MIPFLRYASIFSVKLVSFFIAIAMNSGTFLIFAVSTTLIQSIHGKYYLNDIEAAYGCESQDLSALVDVVDGDCLFFIYL